MTETLERPGFLYKSPQYAPRSPEQRERVAQDVLRSQNGRKEIIAQEIRSGDLWGFDGGAKSYWHCLATFPPGDTQGQRGQWKASSTDSMSPEAHWIWQEWR